MTLIERLALTVPIVQAPMAGVSTPAMAAAVSNAGALGSIAVGAMDARGAATMIDGARALTDRPFNVNVFVHAPPRRDAAREAAWLAATAPLFAEFGAERPDALKTIYKGFAEDDDMLALLVDRAPAVVSFHFGLPPPGPIAALKAAGCLLFATATKLAEARAIEAAGVDAIVAQGWEAGGHRGVFDPHARDERLEALALTRLLVANARLPVITAGGIMDGQGVSAALDLGAVAAQLGTAFIAVTESSADAAWREALTAENTRTVTTRAISGRSARGLANRFTAWGETTAAVPPDYPVAYDAGKALNAAARAKGETGYGAQWAGTGAPLSRAMPAAELVTLLCEEAGLPTPTPSS